MTGSLKVAPVPSCAFSYCVFTCVVDMTYMVYFNFFCCLLIPLVAMFVIYGHIFLTVRRQLRRISAVGEAASRSSVAAGTGDAVGSGVRGGPDLEPPGTGSRSVEVKRNSNTVIETKTTTVYSEPGISITLVNNTSFCDPTRGESSTVQSNIRSHQELRKAASLFLVLFLFMVCWMPIHLIHCILLLCPHCDVPTSLTFVAILLSHANSALNPILYAYRMRSFRHTVRGMWRGIWTVRHQ